MAKRKALLDAEALVRKVLTESFKQKADAETVRAVAEKISQIVAESVQRHGWFGQAFGESPSEDEDAKAASPS
jgi:hypothetical protein